MPVLRKLAKEIARGNWNSYLKVAKDNSHEEIMLQGMIIASVSPKIEFSEVLRYITYYVPKLSTLGLCVDAFLWGHENSCTPSRRSLFFYCALFKNLLKNILYDLQLLC